MLARASLALLFLANALTLGHLGLTSIGSVSTAPAAGQSSQRYLNPLGVALDPEGRRAFVALNGADAVAEVDLIGDMASMKRDPRAISNARCPTPGRRPVVHARSWPERASARDHEVRLRPRSAHLSAATPTYPAGITGTGMPGAAIAYKADA